MRIHIPLMPIFVDVQWRPLRPFQVQVRDLMLAVGIAGLVFSLGGCAVRYVDIGNRHMSEAIRSNQAWHTMMAQRYHHTGWMLGIAFWVILMMFAALVTAAALGRVLDGLHRRSDRLAQE